MEVSFGERVKFARKEAKLNQEHFAYLIGVTQSALSQIENDRIKPSDETAAAIQKALESHLSKEYLESILHGKYFLIEPSIVESKLVEPMTLERFVQELQALGVEDFNPAKGIVALTSSDMEEILAVARSTVKTMVEQRIKARQRR